MSTTSLAPAAIETAAHHLFVNKSYSLAAFVMLAYDTLLTLDREVEAIWKARWSSVKILFLFNRYASIGAYAVGIVALHSTWKPSSHWTHGLQLMIPVRCKSYVLFPSVFNLILQITLGLTLVLFTYAIFNRSKVILGLITSTFIAQIVVTGWSLSVVIMVPLGPGFVGCVWAGKSGTGIRIILAWIMQLVFVTVVFALMIWKAFRLRGMQMNAPLIEVITKDGLKHFSVIFAANFGNVLTFAAKELRPINATFSNLITILMINRLVLSVREEADSARYPTEKSTIGDHTPYSVTHSRTSEARPAWPPEEFEDDASNVGKATEVYELEDSPHHQHSQPRLSIRMEEA